MRHRSAASIKNSMGHLGTTPQTLGSEVFKKVAHGAFDMFRHVSEAMGIKEEHLKLRQVSQNDDMTWIEDSDLPREFSWRQKMPECLGLIEDQGECGSCWAFTSAGLLSDRFCIHTEGGVNVRLSPQDLVDCNYENYGCQGGYLITSIDYLMVEGAVSNTCTPYVEKT